MRRLLLLLIPAVLAASAAPAGAESIAVIEARNDGFVQGGQAVFRTGLRAGDIIAARLSTGIGPAGLIGLVVMFGGVAPSGPHPVTIKIWDDTAETLDPGTELVNLETTLLASSAPQMISLAGIGVPDRFRVGVVLHQDAPPTVAHDSDGTLDVDRNLVRLAPSPAGAGGWDLSQTHGATGDWIIRAFILPSGGGGGGGGGSGSGGSGSGACFGVDCPAGQFCDGVSRSCTFECVTEDDCGGAFCNANGQCVGEGTGCCQADGGSGAAAAGLGLGVLALLLVRRRRR